MHRIKNLKSISNDVEEEIYLSGLEDTVSNNICNNDDDSDYVIEQEDQPCIKKNNKTTNTQKENKPTSTKIQEMPKLKYPLGSVVVKIYKDPKGRQICCKKCRFPIFVGQLMMGIQVQHWNAIFWRHVSCFSVKQKYFLYDVSKVYGFQDLEREEKRQIYKHLQCMTKDSLKMVSAKQLQQLKNRKKSEYYQEEYLNSEESDVEDKILKIMNKKSNKKNPNNNNTNGKKKKLRKVRKSRVIVAWETDSDSDQSNKENLPKKEKQNGKKAKKQPLWANDKKDSDYEP